MLSIAPHAKPVISTCAIFSMKLIKISHIDFNSFYMSLTDVISVIDIDEPSSSVILKLETVPLINIASCNVSLMSRLSPSVKGHHSDFTICSNKIAIILSDRFYILLAIVNIGRLILEIMTFYQRKAIFTTTVTHSLNLSPSTNGLIFLAKI